MDKPDALPLDDLASDAAADETTFEDRHGYLRPGRYFHFYLLYEPNGRKTCWLPDGYHT